MRDPGSWNFQLKRIRAALAWKWINAQLLPHLVAWFADDENGKEGLLALKDLGAPVCQYATKNSHTTKSDTVSVQGSSMDEYLKAAATFIPTSASGPCQPMPKKGFRPNTFRGSRSYAETCHEQQHNLQQSTFPTMPAAGTVHAPVVLTSASPQQPVQAAGNVSPNSSLFLWFGKNQ